MLYLRMDNSLLARLGSLSYKERYLFYKRLNDILNDRYSCFVYGGMNNDEYATMPKNKLERLEVNLYNHMFEKINPPMRIIIDSLSPNKVAERLDVKLSKLSKLGIDNTILSWSKSTNFS